MRIPSTLTLGVLISAASVLVAWRYALPAYRQWRQELSLVQARGFMVAGDYRQASLSARRALELNPANVEACTIIADLAEKHGAPNLLQWRQRIAELAPTASNKLMFASAAIRASDPQFALAARILDDA